jgi:hypothetical protein
MRHAAGSPPSDTAVNDDPARAIEPGYQDAITFREWRRSGTDARLASGASGHPRDPPGET